MQYILDADSLADLKQSMVETVCYEFGWLPLNKRIDSLANDFGVSTDICEDTATFIKEVESVRHIYVHNGGRISNEFKSRINVPNRRIGDIFELDDPYLEQVNAAAKEILHAVYVSIADKFFNQRGIALYGTAKHDANGESLVGNQQDPVTE
jgi:hypothetical protein